jgi:2-polyprenyl-3-methyl-5-hydroxy-6-metoxy-1,4-benzoquinol methylase
MFFNRRAMQAEYFDLPGRSESEIAGFYGALARINRLFNYAEPFQRLLPKYLGRENCRSLSFLDLGAGDGSLGVLLGEWAANKRRWNWRFTNLDVNLAALRLGKGGCNVAGSVVALPFGDASFDLVIASQMTHHLATKEEIQLHLTEAWRVARRAIFFSDLHRGPLLYSLLWLMFQLRRYPKHFQYDGLLSVRRGFRVHELRALARDAGIVRARAWLYYGTRVILQARKY